jgi:hypothetical protein
VKKISSLKRGENYQCCGSGMCILDPESKIATKEKSENKFVVLPSL